MIIVEKRFLDKASLTGPWLMKFNEGNNGKLMLLFNLKLQGS